MKNIFVLYTGGTIGMVQSAAGLRPDAAIAQTALSPFSGSLKARWHICNPLIDSSALTPQNWADWLAVLHAELPRHDGALILHGTDTLAYTAALLALYHEAAELESPLVPIILNQNSGVLHGKAEIGRFLEEGTRRRPNEWVRWYRSGQYLASGDLLVWEYPRQTPDGEQIDILELMQLKDGLIWRHRIYWGWFGTQMLIQSALSKA